jgi:homoserine kinase
MESFSAQTKNHCLYKEPNLSLINSCYGLGRFRNKSSRGHLSHVVNVRCNVQQVSLKQVIQFEPTPVLQSVKAFAPATIANLGPGFDFLGCAVEGLGDHVSAEVNEDVEPGKILISFIDGDNNRLSLNPMKNCAGIAAKATMELLGVRSVGLSLALHKGLPLGSGLGSSAASAAAAAVAVNALFGSKLTKSDLVLAGLESEAAVSGYHADNVAPSLMGGFVLVRSYSPLDLIPLPFPSEKELFFVLVTPAFEAPTKEMRAVLPKNITMKDHIQNCSQAAALVAAILQGDACLLGASLSSDSIVEPKRGPLIPGMMAVKAAALETGAFGCTISGAGPTAVAITDTAEKGKAIAVAMVDMFQKKGLLEATASVQKLDRTGARVV